METRHRVVVGDAREMDDIGNGEVDQVVTSPPYPMIEMWDESFAARDERIGERLAAGDGDGAFRLMHAQLDGVWDEVARVLAPGGIACVNVGDATRSVGETFERYPNHARITERFRGNGLRALPSVLWRKPTNKASKFMGSGTLPSNAYVTLEHEHVLVFRNGSSREFEPKAPRRYESAYFWEERNEWFSDTWSGITGTVQAVNGTDGTDYTDEIEGTDETNGTDRTDARDRSGAFPFEIPYRLINMYSIYGDTVLDPFWGTGTTSLAAMVAGRNSIGYEIEPAFVEAFDERMGNIESLSRRVLDERLRRHRRFVDDRREAGDLPSYAATNYGFPVVTNAEREIQFYAIEDVTENRRYREGNTSDEAEYRVSYAEFDDD